VTRAGGRLAGALLLVVGAIGAVHAAPAQRSAVAAATEVLPTPPLPV